jgi:hypothetical protein
VYLAPWLQLQTILPHDETGARLLAKVRLERFNFEIIRQICSSLRPPRRLTAQIHCAYAFAAGDRVSGRQSNFKVKLL